MVQDYEPLISDTRLERIEGELRREFPALSDQARFVTFIQPPAFAPTEGGVEVPIPEVAVLAILEPNPRHEGYLEITPVNCWYETWREREKDNRHSSDINSDTAYRLYRTLGVPAHLERIKNLCELN